MDEDEGGEQAPMDGNTGGAGAIAGGAPEVREIPDIPDGLAGQGRPRRSRR